MFSRGEFTVDNVTYGAILSHTKICTEAVLVLSGQVVSAYKTDITGSYSYNNNRAKEFVQYILKGAKSCTSKNGTPAPFVLGAVSLHEFVKAKVSYLMQIYRGEVVGAAIQSERITIELQYCEQDLIPKQIPYVKLTEVKKQSDDLLDNDLDAVPVRSVEEIALEKESVEWLANKKYYIVNDDKTAEELFTFLENYNNVIAYDTETTGLRINCFGKIGSSYMKTLEDYNNERKPEDRIRADKLVGIIFCVEPDVSYYFPCFNRKFKNLYQDKDSEYRKRLINNIRARYTLSNSSIIDMDMYNYVTNTSDDDMDLGVLLMERVRIILSTKHLVAHNGTFEWKVGHQYGIDTNIKDDTMLMHKIMYKFRSTTSNRGEPSDLKYLAKRELGIDQWELKDFFPNLKGESSTTRKKKGEKKASAGSRIDFSYMDYAGTKLYAPTDGDVTLQLFYKYKKDLVTNNKEMIYIYEVELIVSLAIAYMEFYGHRIDENKIENAKNQTLINLAMIESEIRQTVNYADETETGLYNKLKELRDKLDGATPDVRNELETEIQSTYQALKDAISNNTKHVINLSAPGQVADLFYDILKYPLQGDKKSVAKGVLKALLKEKNEDGSPKYPAANLYSKYKAEETLLSKFFDNLQYFMYPGGFIFSSYGQIAAATGRMSCIAKGELIGTKYGYREIQSIKTGDFVLTYDDYGNIETKKVLRLIDNGVRPCIELTFENNTRQTKLVCTPDHRIRTTDGRWVKAIEISKDDEISGSIGYKGQSFKLINIKEVGEKHVYDLEVEENHNFIASNICVHNCSKPNAQQYPKVITKIVYPRDGYVMIDADYSQIEYRVLTAMAHNEELAQMFSDPDSDYHTLMASLMYEVDYASVTPSMRSSAKSFNFGIPYGMGFASLALLLHGNKKQSSIDDAKDKYELYFKNQPRTRQFFDNVKEMAQINGWTKTLFNRYRHYSFVDADGNINNARKAAALRQAGNAVIQGCLDGNTKIQTKKYGIVNIKDVVNQSLLVWDGNKWSQGDILYSGKKRKCIVTFSTGQKFICSPTHKFLVKSSKGNERFVECQNLRGSEVSKNPHRVVINRQYEKSDYTYSSEWAYKYKGYSNNAKNTFLEDIGDSYGIGVVLGRLASDGSIIKRDVGASYILQYVAEHEYNIINTLSKYMSKLGCTISRGDTREDRNEKMCRIYAYSGSLTNEVADLDVKHKIDTNIFMDTELLRGFISGFFDGDGGISGKTITLTFGNQYDFDSMCRDLQKALLFFGIRCRYRKYDYRYILSIKTNDNQKFLDLIGFINQDKQNAGRELTCIKDEHLFGNVLVVESVEITDEYIDMYDVCNTDGGYYVADGIITHNTAADIFKIGVARNFNYIRQNNLFGKLLIVNMIHDEQLMEVNVNDLNVQRVLTDVCKNMQFKIEGFPPLFVGAGLGKAWGIAKSKDAEIDPRLLDQLTKESESIPIFQREGIDKKLSEQEVLDYFNMRIFEFRKQKVYDYLANPENWHKDIHPAIGSLINLQFNYGRGDSASGYTGPNGQKYTDQEFLELNIADFLKENNIEAEASWFKFNDTMNEQKKEEQEKENEGYDDNEDEEEVDDIVLDAEDTMGIFSKIDESDKLFGSSVQDIINIFGCCILIKQKLCGISLKGYNWRQRDSICSYLENFGCSEDDPDALRVVFLKDSNVLTYADFWVKNIKASELEAEYKSLQTK